MFNTGQLTLVAPPAPSRPRLVATSACTVMATALAREDSAEEHAGLSPHDRITCPVHRRWVHQCASSPEHAIRVTGHRWCRSCDAAVTIAVDELTGTVTLTCPRCHRSPDTAANHQVLRSCRASIDAARQDRPSTPSIPSQRQVA